MNSYVEVRGVRLGEGRPKICVPLVGKKEEEIFAQARKLLDTPADLAEWRADWFEGLQEPRRLLGVLEELRKLLGQRPLLFTIRTAQEGGEKELTDQEYGSINLRAAGSGWVDLVDVEVFRMSAGAAEERLLGDTEGKDVFPGEEDAGELAQFLKRPQVSRLIHDLQEAGVRVIGSSHDFSRTPGTAFMVHCLRAMQELGVDVCKLAVMPRDEKDVINLLQATWQMKSCFGDRPLITMSMGKMGALSRVAGELYGSALTFGTAGQASAPGQVEAGKLQEVLELLHGEERPAKSAPSKRLAEALQNGIEPEAFAEAIGEEPGHIFLIGFMGTGKSTVARKLQELLGRERIEMDAGIEEQEGQRITELFARYGEAYFREKETAYLQSLGSRAPAVVSCGGGVVVREENTAFMKSCGKIVLLTASPQTVLERVRESQDRPILNGNMNVEYIARLMEKRRELYETAADLIVATDGKDVEAVCREILEGIQETCMRPKRVQHQTGKS